MGKIYAGLPEEVQMGMNISNLENMLQYVANFSRTYRTTGDVTAAKKREALTTNPGIMWRKLQVYMHYMKPTYTDEQVIEEAWNIV